MTNIYIEKVNDIHSTAKTNRQKQTNLQEACNSIKNEITSYDDFIHSFFSVDGSSHDIHTMYEKLHDDRINWRPINVIDLNMSSNTYNEYSQGMLEFVNEIMRAESATGYQDNLEKAKKNDSLFIESIFGGQNNAYQESSVLDAVKNIEFLIDFIPNLSSFKEQCDTITSNSTIINENVKDLVDGGVNLYFESVSDYCFNTMKFFLETFDEMNSVLDNKAKETVSISPFQLF